MASPANVALNRQSGKSDDSDYGSDFSPEESDIVNQLLTLTEAPPIVDIEDNPNATALECHDSALVARIPRFAIQEGEPVWSATKAPDNIPGCRNQHNILLSSVDPGYPDLSNALSNLPQNVEEEDRLVEIEASKTEEFDGRSPLERFRTRPKKGLSVTDLVSPAWCELQYWYTLTKHGRKRRTPAMKQGSLIHKELEEQVYTTVKIDIQSREDAFGLRIWNVIQGLRTLNDTGHTRELEIWGIIDGQVVNGVIDEISFICPDEELEQEFESRSVSSKDKPPADQKLLSDYFKTGQQDARPSRHGGSRKIYICDVKTRSVPSLPKGAAFRPTKFQLMLYHHLLGSLATNSVDFPVLASRHDLDPNAPFSDAFIAQVGGLDDEVFYDASSLPSANDDAIMFSQDSMTMLLEHNSLSKLWTMMIHYLQQTLPNGKASIGSVLKAEYRSREGGEILGCNTFAMDADVLKMYINHEMLWWKGEREPEGVVMEEAYKCRSCDFADICEWRLQRIEEAVQQFRSHRKSTT